MDSLGFSIIAKTGLQQQVKIPVSGREVLQPFTWYTCPAGKRAICVGSVIMTGRGAASVARFNVAGVIYYAWDGNIGTNDWRILPRNLRDSQEARFNVELAAGEIIQTTQDAGTNAEFNVFMEVEELPV